MKFSLKFENMLRSLVVVEDADVLHVATVVIHSLSIMIKQLPFLAHERALVVAVPPNLPAPDPGCC